MKKRRGSTAAPPRTGGWRPPGQRSPDDDARVGAAWIVDRTLSSLAPVDTFLEPTLAGFDDRDQGLVIELVLGTLRWLRRIDHVISAASHRDFERIEPALRAPLRVAAYQLLFLDRIPAHAAVNEAVEQAAQATHRGGASFVNAVLRRIARSPELASWPVEERDPVRRLAVEMSHPDLLVRRWIERLGEAATRRLLAENNRAKPMQLLAFRDRGGRELLAESLIDEGIEVAPAPLSVLGVTVRRGNPLTTAAFERGDFYIQDEVSQVAALLPPPAPGERVLDTAAAPGGKSFAMLAHDPELPLVACDASLERIQRLRANLARLGRKLPLVVTDAGRPALAGGFDRVVIDLPCSGTGTLRRHPEIKWRISEDEVDRLSSQALRLLAGAASLVSPGGLLVAITCSLEEEENEQVVERFLARADGAFSPVDLAPLLAPPLDAAVRGPGLWRVFPERDHDGFTVQVLRRQQ